MSREHIDAAMRQLAQAIALENAATDGLLEMVSVQADNYERVNGQLHQARAYLRKMMREPVIYDDFRVEVQHWLDGQ